MLFFDGVKPEIRDKKFIPVRRYGIQTMYIGYLVDAKTPMIWRGPMVSQVLQQLLYDTLWEDLGQNRLAQRRNLKGSTISGVSP